MTRLNEPDPYFYDLDYAKRNAILGDVDWYVEQCAGCEAIWVLGAGTGRIAVPLAQAGHSVIAVDKNPAMLGALKERAFVAGCEKRLTLVAADLTDSTETQAALYPRRRGPRDCAVIPFNTLNLIGTCVVSYLTVAQGFRLLLDFAIPCPGLFVAAGEDDLYGLVTLEGTDGRIWESWEAGSMDLPTLTRTTTYLYRERGQERRHRVCYKMRTYPVGEVLSVLARAGFTARPSGACQDFKGTPVQDNAVRCVISARRV